MRRNLNMTYIVENNGCYGLTKGQDSATMDTDSVSKRATSIPILLVWWGLRSVRHLLASFSGDKGSSCRYQSDHQSPRLPYSMSFHRVTLTTIKADQELRELPRA